MKKKILSVMLSLCMVLTLMPAASGIAWAEETGNENTGATPTVAVENVTFNYAYDAQRSGNPIPTKGQEVTLSSLSNPLKSDKTSYTSADGQWKLVRVGTYSYVKSLGKNNANLDGVLDSLVNKEAYKSIDKDTIIIHKLQKNEEDVAYGVIVAYGDVPVESSTNETEKVAIFLGDNWNKSGAGYVLSQKSRSKKFTMKATLIATDFIQSNISIALDQNEKYNFGEAAVGYTAPTKNVTITNTGDADTGSLNIALSGTDSDKFNLDKKSSEGIAVNGEETFTVSPNAGLSNGTYKATVTVSGPNIVSQSFDVTFTVKASDILVSPAELAFAEVTVGYSTVDAKTVEVKNNGNAATGELNVVLTGDNAENFTLTKTESDFNIDAGKTATFTVKPKDGLAAGTYETVVEISGTGIAKISIPVSFTVKAASSGGSYHPSIQKPTIITDDGADATLNYYGDKLTIKAKDGYDLADVLLNGVSKGKVTEVTGLRTGDKVEVKTAKKQEEPQKPTKEEIIAGVNGSRLVARSRLITLDNGKKAIRITWYDKAGMEVNFDGVEVYRSVKKNKGYGKKAFYETKDGQYEGYYINTKNLKEGTRYYYKVRGYVVLDGQKYFTEYSYKAFRTVK